MKHSKQKSKHHWLISPQGKISAFLIILILVLAVPVTILLAQQQQVLNQHAQIATAPPPGCSPYGTSLFVCPYPARPGWCRFYAPPGSMAPNMVFPCPTISPAPGCTYQTVCPKCPPGGACPLYACRKQLVCPSGTPLLTPTPPPAGTMTPTPSPIALTPQPSCNPAPPCNPRLGILCKAPLPCQLTITPTPACLPRPSCLDATPACALPQPPGGWCQPAQQPLSDNGMNRILIYLNKFLRGLAGR